MEKKIYECDLCGKSENEVVLLKYPFTTIYKNVETSNEHVDQDACLCIECLIKDSQTEEIINE